MVTMWIPGDQWKDPTEDTSDDERDRADYETEMLLEYAADLDRWEPDIPDIELKVP